MNFEKDIKKPNNLELENNKYFKFLSLKEVKYYLKENFKYYKNNITVYEYEF